MAERKTEITVTGQVSKTPCYYHGYTVTAALAAVATINDGTTAVGTVVDVIPAATPAGTTKMFPTPIKCTAGLYASLAGAGTILFILD